MGIEHCDNILDSSNSFLRLYTLVPSAISVSVINSV